MGCGPWTRPTKPNPAYKGPWKAPMVDNPAYKVGEGLGKERTTKAHNVTGGVWGSASAENSVYLWHHRGTPQRRHSLCAIQGTVCTASRLSCCTYGRRSSVC